MRNVKNKENEIEILKKKNEEEVESLKNKISSERELQKHEKLEMETYLFNWRNQLSLIQNNKPKIPLIWTDKPNQNCFSFLPIQTITQKNLIQTKTPHTPLICTDIPNPIKTNIPNIL